MFELVNPISAVNKAVLFGSFAGVFTLVAIVFAELFWAHRVWCRALCPLGGMYETQFALGLVSVKIDHDLCVHCGACQAACLCDPEILTMSFRARQAVLSQVIACCAGNAWMHVRIRPLKLGSRRRDILSCRGCHAIHAARGQLHLECHRLGKRWLRSAFCYRSEQGLRGFPVAEACARLARIPTTTKSRCS